MHRIGAFVVILTLCVPVSASLTPSDAAAMTSYLEKLQSGWDQPSVDSANDVFMKSEYGPEAWTAFFEHYFQSHPLTDPLWNYLYYPTFHWLGADVNLTLQQAWLQLGTGHADLILRSHSGDLGGYLGADVQRRETFQTWLRVLATLASTAKSPFDPMPLYEWAASAVRSHAFLPADVRIDPVAEPWVNLTRAQIHIILRDALPLTSARRSEIAGLLGLRGTRLALWERHALLLHDNSFFVEEDVAFLLHLLDSIPAGLPLPGNLMVIDALESEPSRRRFPVAETLVNVFAIHLRGAFRENGFPPDVAPFESNGFALVAIHEVNHVVDCELMCDGRPLRSSTLAERRQRLIESAGADHMNYLRSILPDGFFVQAPQELVASISNMYFADTGRTFEVGLARLAAQRSQPMEQFLFMLDLYSVGGNRSRGYTLDVAGRLESYDIPLVRDARGRIGHFVLRGRGWTVTYDHLDNVVDVRAAEGRRRTARH